MARCCLQQLLGKWAPFRNETLSTRTLGSGFSTRDVGTVVSVTRGTGGLDNTWSKPKFSGKQTARLSAVKVKPAWLSTTPLARRLAPRLPADSTSKYVAGATTASVFPKTITEFGHATPSEMKLAGLELAVALSGCDVSAIQIRSLPC